VDPHPPSDPWAGRLYFADHLRVALTILVVLHHVSVIYGANTAFYYIEPPPPTDVLAYLVLLIFELLNQAYFMGFFFLLSGYFSPASLDRKGPGLFLRDRLIRLGIPLVAFMLLLNPLAAIGIWQMPVSQRKLTVPLTWAVYPKLIGPGPMWFIEMLLMFDVGYAAWRLVRTNPAPDPERIPGPPSYLQVGILVLALAIASYLTRIVAPLGASVPVLAFPTPSYLPQDISFFILGIVAFRRDWLRTISRSMGRVGFAVALGATILLFPIALTGKLHFLGGGYWQSGVYALWDSLFLVGMILGLITLFRRLFNRTGRSAGSSLATPIPSTSFTRRSSSSSPWRSGRSIRSSCSSLVWPQSSRFRSASPRAMSFERFRLRPGSSDTRG
jgi:hypothetical protein